MIKNRKDLKDVKIVEETKYGITTINRVIFAKEVMETFLNKYCADHELEHLINDFFKIYTDESVYCMRCERIAKLYRCNRCRRPFCLYCQKCIYCYTRIDMQCFQCNKVFTVLKTEATDFMCEYCNNVVCSDCHYYRSVICDPCLQENKLCKKCTKPFGDDKFITIKENNYCVKCVEKSLLK